VTDRTPAVVLYSRRVPGSRGLLVETLGHLTGAIVPDGAPRPARAGLARWLDRNAYSALSYVIDWLDAFRRAPALAATCCNIMNLAEWPRARRLIAQAPLVVILHSAAGDDLSVIARFTEALRARRGKLLLFFGNEYTLMPQKIEFAQSVAADFIASQLPPAAAAWLYEPCRRSRVLHAPAALNPARFRPLGLAREIDLGFRGDLYPFSIGDDERTRVLEHFRQHAKSLALAVDIQYTRVPGPAWNECLNRWHGIVGAESGTYFLERDDATERRVRQYLHEHPDASFADVRARFFDGYASPVAAKAISSRHFEPIGAHTCQVLLAGHYNGILRADEHYFSVARDLSNLDDVVARYRDPAHRARIVEAALELAMSAHTYDHRVARLVDEALA